MVSGNQDLGDQCFRGCGLGGISAPQGTFGDVWRVAGCHSCGGWGECCWHLEGGAQRCQEDPQAPEAPQQRPPPVVPTSPALQQQDPSW